jgi:hypothetical protein
MIGFKYTNQWRFVLDHLDPYLGIFHITPEGPDLYPA